MYFGGDIMQTEKKTKTNNIIKTVVLFILFAISLALSIWIADSETFLFNSVLDKYLNLNNIVLYMSAATLNMIFAALFLLLFIIRVVKLIKHKNIKQKKASTVVISLFVVMNIILLILLVCFQVNESRTIDTIPDSVTSYVDINEVYSDVPKTDDYFEQVDFGKITSEIPVNYSVQQRNSDNYIKTSCIEITDPDLLSEYYDEQKERFSINNITDFGASQLDALSADNGCYWKESDISINFLLVKGDKVFNVNITSDNVDVNDRIIAQLAAL